MPKKARAYWKGYLRLSLVSIAVEVYNAVESSSEISFRQIHKPSGKRVNYEKVVQGIGKIDTSDIVKGYEVDTDTYVTLEPEEVDAVKLESKKTIDIVQFVDVGEIDWRYLERPYYIVPADTIAGEGYAVMREAMRKMQQEGVLSLLASGGYEVRSVSQAELTDLYRCRAALERLVAEEVALSFDEAQAEMQGALAQLRERHISRLIDEIVATGLSTPQERERYQELMAMKRRA